MGFASHGLYGLSERNGRLRTVTSDGPSLSTLRHTERRIFASIETGQRP
jgi:hypothetical protein